MTVRELRNALDDIEEQDVDIVLMIDGEVISDMQVVELTEDECEENDLENGSVAISAD